jgi:hypothetical protein
MGGRHRRFHRQTMQTRRIFHSEVPFIDSLSFSLSLTHDIAIHKEARCRRDQSSTSQVSTSVHGGANKICAPSLLRHRRGARRVLNTVPFLFPNFQFTDFRISLGDDELRPLLESPVESVVAPVSPPRPQQVDLIPPTPAPTSSTVSPAPSCPTLVSEPGSPVPPPPPPTRFQRFKRRLRNNIIRCLWCSAEPIGAFAGTARRYRN